MNTRQACQILEIDLGASSEDVNKAFRAKAIKFHPDRNKSPDAEAKFKEINEAKQFLDANGTEEKFADNFERFKVDFGNTKNPINQIFQEFFVNMSDNNNVFNYTRVAQTPPLNINIEIPFELSVLGGRYKVSYERIVQCKECNGLTRTSDGKQCTKCSGLGKINDLTEITINIPPGVKSGFRLLLKRVGNFNNGNYGNVICNVVVKEDNDLSLDEYNVVSTINISLLEALTGTKKKIKTVKGERTLSIPSKIKNKESISVSNFGVPPNGSHIVIVEIDYPNDVSELIKVLENAQESVEEIKGEIN